MTSIPIPPIASGRVRGRPPAHRQPRSPPVARVGSITVLLSLSACGGGGDTQSGPLMDPTTAPVTTSASTTEVVSSLTVPERAGPVEDPCALITRQEAEAIVGLDLQEGVLSGAGSDSPRCHYSAFPTGPVGQFEIGTGPGAEKYLEIDRDVLNHAFTEVPGLGDEAWEEDMTIFVRSDTMWIVLHVVRLEEPSEFREPLRNAAQIVLDRLHS